MSPLLRKDKTRSVRGTDHRSSVKIDVEGQTIKVTWLCGGHRVFTPQRLQTVIDRLDRYGEIPGFWLRQKDDRAQGFHAHTEDRKVTANDGGATVNGWVPWDALKSELQAAIREASSQPTT